MKTVKGALDKLAKDAGSNGRIAFNSVTLMALRREPDFLTAMGKPGEVGNSHKDVPLDLDDNLADGEVVLRVGTETTTIQVDGVG